MLSVAGVLGPALYILGGVDLVRNGEQAWRREYLNEVWRYSPAEGWVRRANLPRPTGAAPSPAGVGDGRLYLFGGDDGMLASQAMELKDRHPGFSRSIVVYNPATDRWTEGGCLPLNPGPQPDTKPEAGVWPPVTTSLVTWKDRWVIPSGEVRPGVRTRNVISFTIPVSLSEKTP